MMMTKPYEPNIWNHFLNVRLMVSARVIAKHEKEIKAYTGKLESVYTYFWSFRGIFFQFIGTFLYKWNTIYKSIEFL